LCSQGDEERRLGHDAEARTAYDSALAKNPEAACAQEGIKAVDRLSFTKVINGIIDWTPRVLVAIGAVAVALFILLLFAYFPWIYRLYLKVPGMRSLIGPRLAVADFDDTSCGDGIKVGTAVAARVKTWYQRYRDRALREAERYDLDYSAGAEKFVNIVSGNGALQDAIDNAKDISDQSKTVAALLGLLYSVLPIHKFSVAGTLDRAGADEVAATLTLQDGSKQIAGHTLTAATAQPNAATAPDYLRLARPTALWVHYETTRLAANGEMSPDTGASYAQLREGIDRQEEGDPVAAERAYEEALRFDSRNWAALVNLASLRARQQNRVPEAIALIEGGLEQIRRDEVTT
jgi:hypothetical protein